MWVSVVLLGLFTLLAVRRAPLPPGKRAVLVLALVGLGTVVVAVTSPGH